MSKRYTLIEIAQAVGGEVRGDPEKVCAGVNAIERAGPEELTWVSVERFLKRLEACEAAAVLIRSDWLEDVPAGLDAILVDRPAEAIIKVLAMFAEPVPAPPAGVHPTAVVAASARLGRDVAIGPNVVVEAGAQIGDGTVLHAGVYVGAEVRIGRDCVLWPNVVVRERCALGDRVIVHPNATIGADGFGYEFINGRHVKVPQIGNVVVEDDVEIGAGACIDRAKFGSTRVGAGTKIDNLVQVAHNVKIGPGCILVAHVALGGSVQIGPYSVLGGKVGVRDHAMLAAQVRVGACSCIAGDVPDSREVAGIPAVEARQWRREQAALRRLPRLVEQVRQLARRVTKLESADDHRKRS